MTHDRVGGQTTRHRSRPPLPPMALSASAQTGLVALRLFLGVITVMAVYTFLHPFFH